MLQPGPAEGLVFLLFGLLPLVVGIAITVWALVLLSRISRNTERIATAVERMTSAPPPPPPPT